MIYIIIGIVIGLICLDQVHKYLDRDLERQWDKYQESKHLEGL